MPWEQKSRVKEEKWVYVAVGQRRDFRHAAAAVTANTLLALSLPTRNGDMRSSEDAECMQDESNPQLASSRLPQPSSHPWTPYWPGSAPPYRLEGGRKARGEEELQVHIAVGQRWETIWWYTVCGRFRMQAKWAKFPAGFVAAAAPSPHRIFTLINFLGQAQPLPYRLEGERKEGGGEKM